MSLWELIAELAPRRLVYHVIHRALGEYVVARRLSKLDEVTSVTALELSKWFEKRRQQ